MSVETNVFWNEGLFEAWGFEPRPFGGWAQSFRPGPFQWWVSPGHLGGEPRPFPQWTGGPLGGPGAPEGGLWVGVYPIPISGPRLWSMFFLPKGPKSASRDLPSFPGGSGSLRTPPDGSAWPLGRPGNMKSGTNGVGN